MTTLTEGRHPGEFLLSEASFHRSRDNITIAAGSGIILPGQVLGKITASGKFTPAPATSETGIEGAEAGAAIAIHGCNATSSDVAIAAITRDAEVNGRVLSYDDTVDTDAEKLAKATQLASKGIIVRF